MRLRLLPAFVLLVSLGACDSEPTFEMSLVTVTISPEADAITVRNGYDEPIRYLVVDQDAGPEQDPPFDYRGIIAAYGSEQVALNTVEGYTEGEAEVFVIWQVESGQRSGGNRVILDN